MTSADCTPAWKPTLPPVRVMKLGLAQVPSLPRMLISPRPRRPPNTKPALTTWGMTAMA